MVGRWTKIMEVVEDVTALVLMAGVPRKWKYSP